MECRRDIPRLVIALFSFVFLSPENLCYVTQVNTFLQSERGIIEK